MFVLSVSAFVETFESQFWEKGNNGVKCLRWFLYYLQIVTWLSIGCPLQVGRCVKLIFMSFVSDSLLIYLGNISFDIFGDLVDILFASEIQG